MVVPRIKEDFENKTIEELIVERQKIMKEIIKLETENFLSKNEGPKMIIDPTPEVIWSVMNEDMAMITKIIKGKMKL